MSDVLVYLGLIPYFIYLLYIIGKSYISAYLNQLKVPGLVLSTNEYMFYATRIDTLILALIFVIMLYGFIRYIKFRLGFIETVKQEKKKDDAKSDNVSLSIY